MRKIEQFNKKMKTTPPNISSPAMMDTCKDNDKNKKYGEEKEA